MTNEEHNKYIAWLFIGNGLFQLLMMLVIAAMVAIILFGPDGRPEPPPAVFVLIFGFVFVIQMLFVAPAFIAAYGLLKRKSWARIASIVAGVLSAMNVPVGTAACVYSLWFFMGNNWKSVYSPVSGVSQIGESHSRWEPYTQDERGEYVYRNVEPPDWR